MKAKRPHAYLRGMGLTLALLLAVVVSVALTGPIYDAGPDSAEPETKAPSSARDAARYVSPTAPGAKAASSPDESIAVHGHWTLEVRDPDGTLAQRREFRNALLPGNVLGRVLRRSATVGGWIIMLDSTATEEVCEEPVGTPSTACEISESTDPQTRNNLFKTLVVTAPLTLTGSVIAQRDGIVSGVRTMTRICTGGGISPNVCPGSQFENSVHSFSGTTLSSPVPVTTGQQVQVSVEISFF